VKVSIMVTDLVFRFRMAAIPRNTPRPELWVREVMTMVEVGRILEELGFIGSDASYRLGQASTTIVPLEGFDTVPLETVAAVVGIVHPDVHDIDDEAKEGHMLVVKGETTEEALAAAGFVVKANGPVQ
jgi:predicted RNA binding protein YcfA (HicA-like mRNA interferase family)